MYYYITLIIMQLVFSINLLKLNNDKIISKTDIITIINIVSALRI